MSRKFGVGVGAIFETLRCKSDSILPSHYGPGFYSASNRSNRKIFWGRWRRQMLKIDKFTTFLCRLFGNLCASTSWKAIPLQACTGLQRDCFAFDVSQIQKLRREIFQNVQTQLLCVYCCTTCVLLFLI